MLPTVEESRGYDFLDPENAEKWRGLFINPLRKVAEQVHPTLCAEESALEYVEGLCLRLLTMLCAAPSPLTVQDVEERVARSFPTPLDKWALTDAHETTNQRKKRILLPVDKIHQLLQKEVLLYKVDLSVSTFITAILEYVCADILKLTGNFVKKISQKSGFETVTTRDIKTAMCADKVLMDMFYQDSELALADTSAATERKRRGSLTYSELVRDLLTDERHFLRELNLIIRVFKEEMEKILDKDSKSISLIFGNIVDIYELTVTLLGNLEDACEMAQESPTPYIGSCFEGSVNTENSENTETTSDDTTSSTFMSSCVEAPAPGTANSEAAEESPTPFIGSCFEELAEVEEFRAYVRYANIITRRESRDCLQSVVDDPDYGERLETAGHGFRLAVKYYLPRLLLAPLAHVFLYHGYVLALLQGAPTTDDRESFKQVECNLHPIKKLLIKALGNGPKMDSTLRMATRARRQLAIEKCSELIRLIDNWDTRDIGQCCNEFIREDTLSKVGPGKRIAERRAYLFDGLLLLCKPATSIVVAPTGVKIVQVTVNNSNSTGPGGAQQLKLKEKLYIRKLDIVDKPDTEDHKHLIELWPREGGPVLLACASAAEKRHWMADLVMLNTKPMLDRCLDSILLDLERRHPLKLPPASLYRFAVPDSPDNIILEERAHGTVGAPLIKGATLLKLVERLTYHIYADLNLVRTFLTTYRSFCSPSDLLDLLIERFRVPDPSIVMPIYNSELSLDTVSTSSTDAEKLSKNTAREDWKRYRKEFQQPVRFRYVDRIFMFLLYRVINVIRHWVDQHFYDFERDPDLMLRLKEFLESIEGKPMKKWVKSVLKTMKRKCGHSTETEIVAGGVSHVFDRLPPAVLRHVGDPMRHDWHPLTLHPVELARQLTLLEFQMYRQVKPSELVGAVWTKKDKEKSSPNLLRIIKHTTNLTRWMEKWIVESENLEERVAVVCRFIELAAALRGLNNFNGVLAVIAAAGSAAVHRLKQTFQMVPPRLIKALEEFRALNSDHFKVYCARLRSINPPCVPFFGIYLTNILHIEEGNLDYLPNSELINFSKRRKVAEITGEIQQYQNQPYCLTVEPFTRAFLESLEPFPGMVDQEITNYLYAKSLEIEPRGPTKQVPKFPRKYPSLSLKQVKVSRRQHELHGSTSTIASSEDNASVLQLSPTAGAVWDAQSVQSLPIHHEGSRSEDRLLISPRLERCASTSFGQLSLLDKGLALFDKNKSTNTITSSLSSSFRSCSSNIMEPASPRDRHSPRHDRPGSTVSERKALSPRGAIVDADLFYSRSTDHLAKKVEQEPVPPLLPRGERAASCSMLGPPLDVRLHNHIPNDADASDVAPPPPDRPPPSPKHHDLFRNPGMSPQRPAAPPGTSPRPGSDSRTSAFHFPASPTPPTPHSGSSTNESSAPPLPPRRRRDSAPPAPPVTPHHQGTSPGGTTGSSNGNTAPPLPPRPAPAPALLRPAHSTILQRRHHTTAGTAPRLPPKPVPAARP